MTVLSSRRPRDRARVSGGGRDLQAGATQLLAHARGQRGVPVAAGRADGKRPRQRAQLGRRCAIAVERVGRQRRRAGRRAGSWIENAATTNGEDHRQQGGLVDARIEHRVQRSARARTVHAGCCPAVLSFVTVSAMPEPSARILLVDDEQSIQTLLSYPLRKDGYEVVLAADGREALDRFAEQPFDLVVLDVMMPQLDGLEVCRRLRARSAVPIIMLTAKSEEIDKVRGAGAGRRRLHHQAVLHARVPLAIKAALRRAEMQPRPSRNRAAAGVGDLRDRLRQARRSRCAASAVHLTFVEFEMLGALARNPRPRVHPRAAAVAHLGRLRLPRPAHHRRAHPPPAREARAGRQGARVHLHRARRRLPVPRRGRYRE